MATNNMTPEERRIIRRYQRAYNRVLALFAAALVAAVVLTAIITSSTMSRPVLVQTDEEIVFVEEGDTLWKYAEQYCPNNMDIRKYIQIVRDYNDKDDATLYVGEVVHMPIFTENRY